MFVCERLDAKTPDGRLASITVSWTESRIGLEGLYHVLGVLAVLASLMALASIAVTKDPIGGTLLAALGGSIAWSMFRGDTVTRKRSLVFARDGKIASPEGIATHAKVRELSRSLANIASIEMRQRVTNGQAETTACNQDVAIIWDDGSVSYIATGLGRDMALKIAMQLSKARADMRDAIGRGGGGDRGGEGGLRVDAEREVLID